MISHTHECYSPDSDSHCQVEDLIQTKYSRLVLSTEKRILRQIWYSDDWIFLSSYLKAVRGEVAWTVPPLHYILLLSPRPLKEMFWSLDFLKAYFTSFLLEVKYPNSIPVPMQRTKARFFRWTQKVLPGFPGVSFPVPRGHCATWVLNFIAYCFELSRQSLGNSQ